MNLTRLGFLTDPEFNNVRILKELSRDRYGSIRMLTLGNAHLAGDDLVDTLTRVRVTANDLNFVPGGADTVMRNRTDEDQTRLIRAAAKVSPVAASKLMTLASVTTLRGLLPFSQTRQAGAVRVAQGFSELFNNQRAALKRLADDPNFGLLVDEYVERFDHLNHYYGFAALCARAADDARADERVRSLLGFLPLDHRTSMEFVDALQAAAYDNPDRLLMWAEGTEAGTLLASFDDRIPQAALAELPPVTSESARHLARKIRRARGLPADRAELHAALDTALDGDDGHLRTLVDFLQSELSERGSRRREPTGVEEILGAGYDGTGRVYRGLRALHEGTLPVSTLIRVAREIRTQGQVPLRAKNLVARYAGQRLVDHLDVAGEPEDIADALRRAVAEEDERYRGTETKADTADGHRIRSEEQAAEYPLNAINRRLSVHGITIYPAAGWVAEKLHTARQLEKLVDLAHGEEPVHQISLAEGVSQVLASTPEPAAEPAREAEFAEVFGDALGTL